MFTLLPVEACKADFLAASRLALILANALFAVAGLEVAVKFGKTCLVKTYVGLNRIRVWGESCKILTDSTKTAVS